MHAPSEPQNGAEGSLHSSSLKQPPPVLPSAAVEPVPGAEVLLLVAGPSAPSPVDPIVELDDPSESGAGTWQVGDGSSGTQPLS